MTESLDTKVAVLSSEVKQVNAYFSSIGETLSELRNIAAKLEQTNALAHERLTRAESDINEITKSSDKMEGALNNLREQVADLKFFNHAERVAQQKELLEAIEGNKVKMSTEFLEKLDKTSNDLESKISKLREDTDILLKFKWSSIGAFSLISAEIVARLSGVL